VDGLRWIIWNVIHIVWRLKLQTCELVRCPDEKILFSLHFSFIHSVDPKIMYNIFLWLFFLFLNSQWAIFHAYQKSWTVVKTSDDETVFAFFDVNKRCPLFWLFFCLWCVVADPCFITITKRKILRTLSKQHFEIVIRFRFWPIMSKRGTYLADNFLPNFRITCCKLY